MCICEVDFGRESGRESWGKLLQVSAPTTPAHSWQANSIHSRIKPTHNSTHVDIYDSGFVSETNLEKYGKLYFCFYYRNVSKLPEARDKIKKFSEEKNWVQLCYRVVAKCSFHPEDRIQVLRIGIQKTSFLILFKMFLSQMSSLEHVFSSR